MDPATGQALGTIAWSFAADARRALDAAQAAFAGWFTTTAAERASLLLKMARAVRDNLEDLASLLTLEQGKPLSEARTEMTLGADYLQWCAEEARRVNAEIIPLPWKARQMLGHA